ncbi:MAG: hypothetical protein HFH36_05865 [Lachnospiraceae bacterium]|nr:hypothetical protein [Lachnospiraceae bacterium]
MKKIISISLVCLLIAGLFSACGDALVADRDTVYVQKKGKVVCAAISEFDKDYYDEEELKSYVEERVQAYQGENGKDSVEIDEFTVEDKVAKLYMKYKDCESYQDFNEVTLFSGTVPQALAAGFKFDTEFTKVEDGKANGSVDSTTVMDSDCKVVILSEKIDVKVDGAVQYISSEYTTIKSKDTVSIEVPEEEKDGAEMSLVYVVYK